jgi:hypothetical protein
MIAGLRSDRSATGENAHTSPDPRDDLTGPLLE